MKIELSNCYEQRESIFFLIVKYKYYFNNYLITTHKLNEIGIFFIQSDNA